MYTNSILDSPDLSGSHISKINRNLPYDKAPMPVKQFEAGPGLVALGVERPFPTHTIFMRHCSK
jgi:hypothetical protein